MKQEIVVELTGGKNLKFETGKLAKQAHGSVVVRIGDNVILATAVANPDPREGIDFFPLTVDYREYTYAGGRIPGGFIFFWQGGDQDFLKISDQGVAFRLGMFLGIQAIGEVGANLLVEVVVILLIEFRRLHFPLGFAGFLSQLVNRGDNLFYFSVGEVDSVNDRFFFYFFGADSIITMPSALPTTMMLSRLSRISL